jgi:hypothetical protein
VGLAEVGDVVGGDGCHPGGGGDLWLVPQIGDHGVDEGAAKPGRVAMIRARSSGSNRSRPRSVTSVPMASAATAVSGLLQSAIPPVACSTATSHTLPVRAGSMPRARTRSRAASALAAWNRSAAEWNRRVSPRSCSPPKSERRARAKPRIGAVRWPLAGPIRSSCNWAIGVRCRAGLGRCRRPCVGSGARQARVNQP